MVQVFLIAEVIEYLQFLTQACAGLRSACAWFLKIISVWMSVCVPTPKAIIN